MDALVGDWFDQRDDASRRQGESGRLPIVEIMLRSLRDFRLEFRPAASDVELRELEAQLEGPLPSQVRLLYRDHGGVGFGGDDHFWIRLMSPDEAAEATTRALADDWRFDDTDDGGLAGQWNQDEFALFWTDDNGEFAGVFLRGPFEGHVFLFEEDSCWPIPAWDGVEEFYNTILETEDADFSNLTKRYERGVGDSDDRFDDLARSLLDAWKQDPDSPSSLLSAHQAIAVASPALEDLVRECIATNDMFLQTFVLERLDSWGLSNAEELIGVLQHGGHNAKLFATRALLRLGDEAGLQAVAESEGKYWSECERVSNSSPLRRVSGLAATDELVDEFWLAVWWIGQRLAHRVYDAAELHGAPEGMTPAEIELTASAPDLPEVHLPGRLFDELAVTLNSTGPIVLTVDIPYWWDPYGSWHVATVRLVHTDDGFNGAIDAISENERLPKDYIEEFAQDNDISGYKLVRPSDLDNDIETDTAASPGRTPKSDDNSELVDDLRSPLGVVVTSLAQGNVDLAQALLFDGVTPEAVLEIAAHNDIELGTGPLSAYEQMQPELEVRDGARIATVEFPLWDRSGTVTDLVLLLEFRDMGLWWQTTILSVEDHGKGD